MSLTDTAPEPEALRKARIKSYSAADRHSKAIKDGFRVNRLIRKSLVQIVQRQIEIATDPKYPASAAAVTGMALIERVAGKASSSPDDMAAIGGAVMQLVTAIRRQPTDPIIDVTPTTVAATTVQPQLAIASHEDDAAK